MPFWSKPTGREARACLDLEDPADPGEVPADPAAAPAALKDPDTVRPRPASFTAPPPPPPPPPGPYGRRCRGGCMPGCLLGVLGCAGAIVGLLALLTAVL